MQPDIKNDLTYLLRILESVHKVILYSEDYNDVIDFFFANNQKDFNASLMLFINVGEQTTRIDESLKSRHTNVPWQMMKDFRNRVAHDYAGLDTFKVFDIIKNHLPLLREQIENVIGVELNDQNFLREELDIAKQSKYYKNIDFKRLEE